MFGKWHLANATNGNRDNPNLMGFGHYSGSIGGGGSDYFSWTKVENGTVANGPSNPVTNYATSETASDASDWIQQQGSNQWFCWGAFNVSHTPFPLPPNDLHSSNLSGTAANPRVLRGVKGTLFEGGVKIPCIVSGAAVAAPGRTHNAQISLVDVFTTLLDLAAVDAQVIPSGAATDSRSFAAYITDATAAITHDCQFTEQFPVPNTPADNNDGKTIRLGDWKLIRFDDGVERLYNLPDENTNLADGALTAAQQSNYDALNAKLNAIISDARLGDVNLDGVVTFADIPSFI